MTHDQSRSIESPAVNLRFRGQLIFGEDARTVQQGSGLFQQMALWQRDSSVQEGGAPSCSPQTGVGGTTGPMGDSRVKAQA